LFFWKNCQCRASTIPQDIHTWSVYFKLGRTSKIPNALGDSATQTVCHSRASSHMAVALRAHELNTEHFDGGALKTVQDGPSWIPMPRYPMLRHRPDRLTRPLCPRARQRPRTSAGRPAIVRCARRYLTASAPAQVTRRLPSMASAGPPPAGGTVHHGGVGPTVHLPDGCIPHLRTLGRIISACDQQPSVEKPGQQQLRITPRAAGSHHRAGRVRPSSWHCASSSGSGASR